MFNRQEEKRCSCFTHYFLFYVIPIIYLFCTSCFGVREELIPERNKNISNLPEGVKEMYAIINHSLNDHQKEQLQEKVSSIKDLAALAEYIKKTYKFYKIHKEQVKLYPKSERDALEENFNENICCLNKIEKIINESVNRFKGINNASNQTRQTYIDLLEILPEGEAMKLKNKIISTTNSEHLKQLIKSNNPFEKLDENTKKTMTQLPDKKRQNILKKEYPLLKDKDEGSAITVSCLEGLNDDEDKDENKAIPQDGWGDKLSLEGQERKEFLIHIMEFSISDQKKLKDLFDKAEKGSIINFFEIYFNYKIFNKDERIELLSTMMYLYKALPDLTIKLCNEPEKVTQWEKFQLFKKTNSTQLKLLQKLEKGLQDL